MHFKTRVLLAVGCVSLLAMSIPALSLPAPRGFEHQQRHIQKKKIVQGARAGHAKPHAARENNAVRLVSMPVTEPPKQPTFGWPALVREARKYIGTNPTARTKLWCATFMNLVLAKARLCRHQFRCRQVVRRLRPSHFRSRRSAPSPCSPAARAAAMSAWSPVSIRTAIRSSFPAITATGSARRSIRAPA